MSWPQPFTERMQAQLEGAFPAFLDSLGTASPTSIRLNPNKELLKFPLAPVPWSDEGYYLEERPIFTLDPLFHTGTYYVQEASSMFLGHVFNSLLPDNKEPKVLDLCGAPGGKSTLLASFLPDDGLLVANEVIRSRANILVENVQKWGDHRVVVSHNDPRDFAALEGFFDVMVVDAPCSGEGLFRRDPKAADEWSPANVRLCVERQRRILMDSWGALKPGGILIYSTCTYNLEENEENMAWLASEVDTESLEVPIDPSWMITETELKGIKGYRFYPHKTKGEGLFMAALKKGEGGRHFKNKKSKGSILKKAGKEAASRLLPNLTEPETWALFTYKEGLVAFSNIHKNSLEVLERALKVIHRGIPVGELKKKDFVPAHALAMSTRMDIGRFDTVALGQGDALQFLSKIPLQLATTKGWKLFTYEGQPLGWGKAVNKRVNNYYPQHWRIRMTIPEEDKWFSLKQLAG